MKRKTIIMLLSIGVMGLALILNGCTNEKEELNQSLVITEDVKEDNEPELKVISTEEFYFEEPVESFQSYFTEKDNGETLIRVIAGNNVGKDITVKIEGNKVIKEYAEMIDEDKDLTIGKSFYVESVDDNKALITNWGNDEKFEVEKSLLSNENSRYSLLDKYLIEFVGDEFWNFKTDEIVWTNIEEDTGGVVEMPGDLEDALYASIIGDRLLVATTTLTSAEEFNSKLESNSGFTGYLLPDTLLVIDLSNNKIIEKVTIGNFRDFKAIDTDRIIFILDDGNLNSNTEVNIEMYSLNNKTRKELIKYTIKPGEEVIRFNGLGVFPSKDKIYYCEDNGKTLSLKIAEINGMDIENVITAYEVERKETENFREADISIGKDEREVKIFNRSVLDQTYQIDKLIKIKLSK